MLYFSRLSYSFDSIRSMLPQISHLDSCACVVVVAIDEGGKAEHDGGDCDRDVSGDVDDDDDDDDDDDVVVMSILCYIVYVGDYKDYGVKKAYETVLVMSIRKLDNPEFEEFSNKVKQLSKDKYNMVYKANSSVSISEHLGEGL